MVRWLLSAALALSLFLGGVATSSAEAAPGTGKNSEVQVGKKKGKKGKKKGGKKKGGKKKGKKKGGQASA